MTALQVIDQVTVTDPAGAASISLNSISGDFADLMVVFSGRTTISDNIGYGVMTLNGSGTGYTEQVLQGNSSTYAGSSATGAGINAFVSGGNNTSNTFGIFTAYLPKYSSSTNAKRVLIDLVSENNATGAFTAMQRLVSVYWNNTAAISSITFTAQSGVYVQNSTVTLYGIKENNSLTSPKATGGIVSYDAVNSYWYHTFTASGTFTPNQSISAEYVVVSGGGAGGYWHGGGGGAGGYLTGSGTLTAQGYTVTIGAGGAAGVSNSSRGAKGNSTSFNSISPNGGGGGGTRYTETGGGAGGSGGGGGFFGAAGTATPAGQGNPGGVGDGFGGGGGGAGASGQASNDDAGVPGNGGDGLQWLNGIYYAGGGGGGHQGTGVDPISYGGLGGGGNGSGLSTSGRSGYPGAPGTGGGGGGSHYTGTNKANGGSGTVVIRYAA